jgi:hypothetical protein
MPTPRLEHDKIQSRWALRYPIEKHVKEGMMV